MISVVSALNAGNFQAEIKSMHADRKRVFVDTLKWDVPVEEGMFERDQFDNDDTLYLIASDPATKTHLGSVRLLPTNGPHILGSIFPELCDSSVPQDESIWEISRFLCANHLAAKDRLHLRHQLAIALVEFGLRNNITAYTCVAEMSWYSQVLSMGWPCEPLGLPKLIAGKNTAALKISVSAETLDLFREQWNVSQSCLQQNSVDQAA